MSKYVIYSKSGDCYGIWEGESAVDVLLRMHRDAGYDSSTVWVEDGEMCFKDEEYRKMCGDVDRWDIREE